MPPAANEAPANQTPTGSKVYFKDDFADVFELDPSEVEKARRLGLVSTAEVDAARAVIASRKRRSCNLPKGTYVASYSGGTCGALKETLFDWENPGHWEVPTGCTGDLVAASDRCTVLMDLQVRRTRSEPSPGCFGTKKVPAPWPSSS
jgi:hypothetical protein